MSFLLARVARGVNGESSHKGILPALYITKKFAILSIKFSKKYECLGFIDIFRANYF